MSIGQYASQAVSTFARVTASSLVDTDRSGHSVDFPARITEVSWQRIPSPAVSGWVFRLLAAAAAACSAQAQRRALGPLQIFALARGFGDKVGFAVDSPPEGDGFEPSVLPREKPTSSPVETRSPEPPRGGDGLSAPTGKGQCVQQRQQWRRAGTAHFADQPFGGCACPLSGRVSRWPQPALFAQYSQVRARSRPNRGCSPGCGPRSRIATGT
jgi:hypothetical protein